MGKFGFSKWSWRRASGLSAAKGKVSRAIGVPLTKSGRERKYGRWGARFLWPLSLFSRRTAKVREQQAVLDTVPPVRQASFVGSVAGLVFRGIAVVAGLTALACAWMVYAGSDGALAGVLVLGGFGAVCIWLGLRPKNR